MEANYPWCKVCGNIIDQLRINKKKETCANCHKTKMDQTKLCPKCGKVGYKIIFPLGSMYCIECSKIVQVESAKKKATKIRNKRRKNKVVDYDKQKESNHLYYLKNKENILARNARNRAAKESSE